MLRTFSFNPTCRHIVFGGCHDSGYQNDLDQFNFNELSASRITLLETTPAHVGFAKLSNFKRARFENVFRSEPLPDGPPLTFATNGTSAMPPPSATPPMQHPVLSRTTTNQSPKPSVSSPSPQISPSSVSTKENNGDASWGMYICLVILVSSLAWQSRRHWQFDLQCHLFD